MLVAHTEQDANSHNLSHQLHEEAGLDERVRLCLENFASCIQAVHQEDLRVAKAEVTDEGRIGPFAHPLEI